MNPYWTSTQYKNWTILGASGVQRNVPQEPGFERECLETVEKYAGHVYRSDCLYICTASAKTLIKRYLLKTNRSFKREHIELLVVTALSIVGKIEDADLAEPEDVLERLPAHIKAKRHEIIYCEYLILSVIHFELQFYHPYDYLKLYAEEQKLPRKISQGAWDIINDMYSMGDLIFLYVPHMLAIASVLFVLIDMDEAEMITAFEIHLTTLRIDINQLDAILLRMTKFYSEMHD